MKIETLNYLLVTAKSPSISAAAERLFLSQTTLSAAIRSVEAETGITIFHRSRNGIQITEQGQKFLELAEEISRCYSQILDLSNSDNSDSLPLHLVTNPIACTEYSFTLSEMFRKLYPHTTLIITEAAPSEIVTLISSGDYKYGIGYFQLDQEEEFYRQLEFSKLCCEPLSTFQVYTFVGPANPLYERETVYLSELKDMHLAMSSNGLREYMNANLSDLIPDYTVYSNPYLIRKAVEQSDCIALHLSISSPNDWITENSPIKKLTILDNRLPAIRHCLLYRRQKQFPAEEQALFHCIRSIMNQ